MPWTDATELAVLNHVMGKAALTMPTTQYVGLSSTTPTGAGGSFTEPSTGGYARVAVPAASWGTATGTAPASITNTAAIAWTVASATWSAGANMTHFGVFAASTGGTPLLTGAIATPKPVTSGDTAQIAIGGAKVQLGAPGDTYG